MKTIRELYGEVKSSDELKKAFLDASKNGKTMDFIRAQGCEATEEEIAAFLKSRAAGELSDEELEGAAGGTCNPVTGVEAAVSVLTVSFGCVISAINSSKSGHTGQKSEYEGRLCNDNEG